MTRTELNAQRVALRKRLDELDSMTTTCMHCKHMEADRLCSVFAQRVPEEQASIDFGCESWVDDGIPF